MSYTDLILDMWHGVPLPESEYAYFKKQPDFWELLMFAGEYDEDMHYASELPMDLCWPDHESDFMNGFCREVLERLEAGCSVTIDCSKADHRHYKYLRWLCLSYSALLICGYESPKWKPMLEHNVHPFGMLQLVLSPALTELAFLSMGVLTDFYDLYRDGAQHGHPSVVKKYSYLATYPYDMAAFNPVEVLGIVEDIDEIPAMQSCINYPSWWKGVQLLYRIQCEAKQYYKYEQLEIVRPEDVGEVQEEIEEIIEGYKDLFLHAPIENLKRTDKLINYYEELRNVYMENK